MAFISHAFPSQQTPRRYQPRQTPLCKTSPYSPRTASLIRQQVENPIFDPSLLASPLSDTLQELQSSEPPKFHRPAPDSPRAKAALLIADYHPGAISNARRKVLLGHPGIDGPGGALYPAFRAVACWRDLTAFARVAGYYLAANKGFSDTGIAIMQQIYDELSVPLDAMITGVSATRDELVSITEDEDVRSALKDGFGEPVHHPISRMPCLTMSVAELAKRFERACVQQTIPESPQPKPAGRVKELTRRLEQAVIDGGTPEIGVVARQQNLFSSKSAQPPPRVKHPTNQPVKSAFARQLEPFQAPSKNDSSSPFRSPSPLPRISDIDSHSQTQATSSSSSAPHISRSRHLPPPSADAPAVEKLRSTSKIIEESKIIDATQIQNSVKHTIPTQLSLSDRLAVFERLTKQDPAPPQNSIDTSTTSPAAFSSNSSAASSQRHGPIDLIPDVSEGDLDDIEGIERVEDDASEEPTRRNGDDDDDDDDDDNGTFRRAKTVQTLSSADNQSFCRAAEPRDVPSNPSPPVSSPPADPSPPANPSPPSRPSTPSNASDNSSFTSVDLDSAAEIFPADRPAPHTYTAPPRTSRRQVSNLSAQPHTLQIAPGSFKNLPKAKVMIARRIGHEGEKDDPGASNDDCSTRQLVRKYTHPKELLKGNVSLVELDDDDEEFVEFRDPEVSEARRETSMKRKKNRAEAFRHRYDEFMDPQELEQRNANAIAIEEEQASSSKERYPRRRFFRRGKVEKARQREERLARQQEAVARRSTVISGALDRVSLAADPWIDFITDTNTLPVAKAGGIRRGLKKLFGFGRQNGGLIKTGK